MVKCGQLPNGVRFYSQYESSSSLELPVIVVNAGSLHDPHGKRGLAHLVEHVITEESKTFDSRRAGALVARACGGPDDDILITTSWAATTYGPSDMRRRAHARELFRMFSSMVRDPVIRHATTLVEKAAVHQEHYLFGEDVIVDRIRDALYEATFPKTFLARNPIDGYMEDVRQLKLSDIKSFVNRYYIPSNTFVVYFGPRHEEVKALVANEFGTWKKTDGKKWQKFRLPKMLGGFEPLKQPQEREVTIAGMHQHHAMIGFPTETYLSEDAEALDVLAFLFSERMYSELRSKNKKWEAGAYRTPVETERTFGHGIFSFHFATLDERFLVKGIETFREQCQLLCTELLSPEEVEIAVGFLYDYLFKDSFTRWTEGLLESVIQAAANGDTHLERLHSRGERLQKLLKRNGRQKLREVAQKYLSGNSATVIAKPS